MDSGSQLSDLELREKLLGIIKERDQLREHLELANVALCELENQNIILDKRLTNVYEIQRNSRTKRTLRVLERSFIGPWECSPSDFPALLPVEELFRNGKRQQALNCMPALLMDNSLNDRTRVNAKLLYTALIQSTGRDIRKALGLAEDALTWAYELQLQDLAGKANYWRGLCHLCLEEWPNARWCFVLSSHLHGHTEQIEACRTIVERELLLLPEGERTVSADFKYFCSIGKEDFIRHSK